MTEKEYSMQKKISIIIIIMQLRLLYIHILISAPFPDAHPYSALLDHNIGSFIPEVGMGHVTASHQHLDSLAERNTALVLVVSASSL